MNPEETTILKELKEEFLGINNNMNMNNDINMEEKTNTNNSNNDDDNNNNNDDVDDSSIIIDTQKNEHELYESNNITSPTMSNDSETLWTVSFMKLNYVKFLFRLILLSVLFYMIVIISQQKYINQICLRVFNIEYHDKWNNITLLILSIVFSCLFLCLDYFTLF